MPLDIHTTIATIDEAVRERFGLIVRPEGGPVVAFALVERYDLLPDGRWLITGLRAPGQEETLMVTRLRAVETMPVPFLRASHLPRRGERVGAAAPIERVTTFLAHAHRERWAVRLRVEGTNDFPLYAGVGPIDGTRVCLWDDQRAQLSQVPVDTIALLSRERCDPVVMDGALRERVLALAAERGVGVSLWTRSRRGGGETQTALNAVRPPIPLMNDADVRLVIGTTGGGREVAFLVNDLYYVALDETIATAAPAEAPAPVAARERAERERERELTRDILGAYEGIYGADSLPVAIERAKFEWLTKRLVARQEEAQA